MASRFKLRSFAIPLNTNACTAWGVKFWADWSRSRAVEVDSVFRVNPTKPLLQMPVRDLHTGWESLTLNSQANRD